MRARSSCLRDGERQEESCPESSKKSLKKTATLGTDEGGPRKKKKKKPTPPLEPAEPEGEAKGSTAVITEAGKFKRKQKAAASREEEPTKTEANEDQPPPGKKMKKKLTQPAPAQAELEEEDQPPPGKKMKKKSTQPLPPQAELEEEDQPPPGKKKKKLTQPAPAQAELEEEDPETGGEVKKKTKKKRGEPAPEEAAEVPSGGEKAKKKRAKEAAGVEDMEQSAEVTSAPKKKKPLATSKKKDDKPTKDDDDNESEDSFFAKEKGTVADPSSNWNKISDEVKFLTGEFKIWVGDLPRSVSEETVHADFSDFGEIKRFDMPRSSKGIPDGVAYIYYTDKESVERALQLHETKYHGKIIRVRVAVPQNRPKKEKQLPTSDDLTVCVNNLPFDETEEEDLQKFFSECGEVEVIRMLRGLNGRFKGIAFVVYKTAQAVRKALLLDGEDFRGRAISVTKPRQRHSGAEKNACTVFVGSLSPGVDEETLKADFGELGPVDGVRMVKDADGKFRGAAFVAFKTRAAATKALAWDGTRYYGHWAIKVAPALQSHRKERYTEAGAEEGDW